jgi:transcriptional regulator with XRE-family HTH domain
VSNLRSIRTVAGLSASEVARELGICSRAVERFETRDIVRGATSERYLIAVEAILRRRLIAVQEIRRQRADAQYEMPSRGRRR